MERKIGALLDNTTAPPRMHVGVVRFAIHVEIVFLDAQYSPQVAISASRTDDGHIRLEAMNEEYKFVAQDDGSVVIEPID
jgi:hypothetical protein